MKFLLFIFFFLFLTTPLIGQSSERPEGIVIPVSGIGDVTETRVLIIQNSLIENLSEYYRLVPQDKLEEVQEKVFQELDYEECTEDQCIVMIQEMLQVENLFVLQVIGEGQNTQMSLKWVGLDDKRVKTDVCKGCDTFELNERVEGLVKNLVTVIPKEDFLVSDKIDEEELRKQKEEELRKQKEEELRRQREEELRRQKEEELRRQREEEWSKFIESFKIRGLIGSTSSGDTKVTNTSIYGMWKEYGLGVSQMSFKTKSSSNNEYEMTNSTLDISYTYGEDWTLTGGLGNVTGGNGTITLSSSGRKYTTTSVSGISVFGVFGMEWNDYEGLIGFRFNNTMYSHFQSETSLQKDTIEDSFSIFGGKIMFGFGLNL